MNSSAALSMSAGIMAILVTVARLLGDVEEIAFFQIIGTIVAIPILTYMFKGFK